MSFQTVIVIPSIYPKEICDHCSWCKIYWYNVIQIIASCFIKWIMDWV